MILKLTFTDKNGIIQTVPMAYMQTGPNTQVVAMAVDFDEHPNLAPAADEGVEVMPIGKLSDWQGLSGIVFQNSLLAFGWDFDWYPDPELVQLTDNRISS
jgi:hypothetical protein